MLPDEEIARDLLGRAARLDTFTIAKLPDGTVLIENPLRLDRLAFTRVQWQKAVEMVNQSTPMILDEPPDPHEE